MSGVRFNKKPLAITLSALLGTAVSLPVMAQEAEAEADDTEVIEVRGIRGSLAKAMEVKRDYKGVMDAINAEDIGKFPDTNLAESLQRVTGVSIDRSNGEGSKVTVRGWGPDFNLVTLNGRQMPASSLEATSASSSRSYDFANIASEGISGVEIFKTGRAPLPTGGMGSTINILTTKPLNSPGMNATFGVKGVFDQSSDENSNVTPELSGLYSNTFNDDKFGVAISGSYQERESGNQQANVDFWRSYPGDFEGWGGIPTGEGTDHTNLPAASDIYSLPQAIRYRFEEVNRTRTNGQLTLQYRPVDTLTATVDYTYAKNEVETEFSDLSAWFNLSPTLGVWTDGPISTPIVHGEVNGGGGDYAMGVGKYATVNENKSLGFNVEWIASDYLTFDFDFHSSSAESSPDSPFGSNNVIGTAAFIRQTSTGYFDQDLPVLQITYPEGATLDPSDMVVAGSSFRNSQMRSEIDQFQFEGNYAFDDGIIESIDFGISVTEVKNRSAYANVQQDTWGGAGPAEAIDDSVFTRDTVADKFDVPGSEDARLINEFFQIDFEALRAQADAAFGGLGNQTGGELGDCGTVYCTSSDMQVDRRTEEEAKAAFIQFNMATEIAEKPVGIIVGLRYEETDVFSRALVPTYSNVQWVAENEFSLIGTGERAFTELEGGYDNFLPNIDFDIEIIEDLILRASYSKTIARPSYSDIQGGLTVNPGVRIDFGTGNRGNPNLKPFDSTNLDFSAEWYYSDDSYFSIGYYRKDVKNFIGNSQEQVAAFDLPHPAQGSRYAEAVAVLGGTGDNAAIRQYIIDNFPESVDGNNILGIAGDDASTIFNITVPINEGDALIDGWEVALQHVFGESGFGFIVNATTVDGDIKYDDTTLGEQTALEGLSDSANLIAFYDKDGLQARIAYNWRDEFLDAKFQGDQFQPIYIESYGQWDATVSYEYNDNLTFFAEGLNLTDEYTRSRGRTADQVVNLTQSGPRYNIGLRYKF